MLGVLGYAFCGFRVKRFRARGADTERCNSPYERSSKASSKSCWSPWLRSVQAFQRHLKPGKALLEEFLLFCAVL